MVNSDKLFVGLCLIIALLIVALLRVDMEKRNMEQAFEEYVVLCIRKDSLWTELINKYKETDSLLFSALKETKCIISE